MLRSRKRKKERGYTGNNTVLMNLVMPKSPTSEFSFNFGIFRLPSLIFYCFVTVEWMPGGDDERIYPHEKTNTNKNPRMHYRFPRCRVVYKVGG